MKKEEKIKVRTFKLTEREDQYLRLTALTLKMSVSEFIRNCIIPTINIQHYEK